MLRVLDLVFYQKLSKEALLPAADIRSIFTNLEEVLRLHGTNTNRRTMRSCRTRQTDMSSPERPN